MSSGSSRRNQALAQFSPDKGARGVGFAPSFLKRAGVISHLQGLIQKSGKLYSIALEYSASLTGNAELPPAARRVILEGFVLRLR